MRAPRPMQFHELVQSSVAVSVPFSAFRVLSLHVLENFTGVYTVTLVTNLSAAVTHLQVTSHLCLWLVCLFGWMGSWSVPQTERGHPREPQWPSGPRSPGFSVQGQ